MKVLLAAALVKAGTFLAMGAMIPVTPLYVNNSPLATAPQVDATIFWNRSTISMSTLYPYQAQNVQHWTNNGVMSGFPGLLFEYDIDRKTALRLRPRSRALQRPSLSFHNSGIITGDPILSVNAKSILNAGRLDTGEFGVISLLASNGSADLSRGTLRTGPPTGTFVNCEFASTATNFITDQHIVGRYWGNGRNNALGTNGTPLNLPNAYSFFFNEFTPRSPAHEVRVPRSTFTNVVTVPSFLGCNDGFQAFVFTNGFGTNMSVSIAIVPTNSLIQTSNLDVAVRFSEVAGRTPAGSFPAPIVEFRSIDFDIVDQAFVTNYVTVAATTGSETNVLLGRPFLTGTGTSAERRPSTLNFIYGRACDFDFFAQEANSILTPNIFYDPANNQTNFADTIYAAYSAQVGQSNSQTLVSTPVITVGPTLIPFLPGANPALSDPTNFTGRVEVKAGNLNLANTRIRAQNFINIKADNLVSNVLAQIDAPFYSFDVQSTNSELVLENFAPATVNRLVGQVSAYSTAWTSRVTNNAQVHNIRYQVLIVENCLRSTTPVAVHRFSVNTPALILKDNIVVNHSASIKAKSLLVDSNVTLALPPGSDLAFTNVNNLLNFTNYGTVSVAGGAYFGTFDTGHIPEPPKKKKKRKVPPTPSPLDNFVNRGVLAAQSLFVRATNAELAGQPLFPAFYSATQGVIFVGASTVTLSNITIAGGSDVEFHANDLSISGTTITAGISNGAFSVRGTLVLDATNSFGDFGTPSSNFWQVTAGVRIPTRPANAGDLMQTRIRSTSGPFWETPIVWAGEDRGPVVEGYANNLALGLLTLDATRGNLLHFSGAGGSNAIYVDYLELLNDATNFNFAVGVDPNFTLYFADSNVSPEKLDEAGGGRIRWVSQFTGPRSSTNITYPDGSVHTFNAGVVRSKDRDDDGDGVVNFEDCTPIQVVGFDSTQPCGLPDRAKSIALSTQQIGLTIAHASEGQGVVLSWDAPAGSANTVEFTDSLAEGKWTVFKSFISGPENARVTVKDAAAAPLRVYRVRVDAGKP